MQTLPSGLAVMRGALGVWNYPAADRRRAIGHGGEAH